MTHGPAISRFELELAPGTKVGKISELEKDIAYGMQATSVRIEAPIPGKMAVKDYINYYNTNRPHSMLNYQTPNAYENKYFSKQQNQQC